MPNERIDFGGLSEEDWLAGVDLGMAMPLSGRRAEKDDRWEITKGVSAGIDQLQGIGGGLIGIAGDIIGSESMQEAGIDIYNEQMAEAAESEARISSYENITGVEDAWDYFMHGFGTLIPMFAPSLISGGVGAFAGKRAAQKGVKAYMEKTFKDATAQGLAKDAAGKVAAQKVALGTFTGAYLSSGAMETGSIYGDIAEQTGEREAGVSIIGGALAGFLDAYPAFRLLRKHKLGEELVKKADTFFLSEAGKQLLAEGGTEAAQTVIERFAVQTVDENIHTLSDEGIEEIINAGLIGAFGGGVMGGIGHPMRRRRSEREIKDEVDAEGGDALDAETRVAMEATQEDELDLQRERQTGEEIEDLLDRLLAGTGGRYDLGIYPDDDPTERWKQEVARRRQGGPEGPMAGREDLPKEVVSGEVPEVATPQDHFRNRQRAAQEAYEATQAPQPVDDELKEIMPGVPVPEGQAVDIGGEGAGGAPGAATFQQRQATFAEAREARRAAEAGEIPGVTPAGEMSDVLDEMGEAPAPSGKAWNKFREDRATRRAQETAERKAADVQYDAALDMDESLDTLMDNPAYAANAVMPDIEQEDGRYRMVIKDPVTGEEIDEVFPWRNGDAAAARQADDDYLDVWQHKKNRADNARKVNALSPFSQKAVDSTMEEVNASKSRHTLMYMTPDEFLTVAEELKDGPDTEKQATVEKAWTEKGEFDSIPNLTFENNGDGTATVVGHDGRHRAMKLKELGYTTMAVRILSAEGGEGRAIRWDSQQEGNNDKIPVEQWPQTLKGQARETEIPFPESQIVKPPVTPRDVVPETPPETDPLEGLDLKKIKVSRRSKKDGKPGKATASAEVLLRHHQKREDSITALKNCLLDKD